MITMFARVHVADYDAWRAAHEGFAETRKAFGERGSGVYRSVDDPLEVTVWQRFDDVGAVRAFLDSPEAAEVAGRAGFVGEPQIWLTEDQQ